jgi:VanZ family protein
MAAIFVVSGIPNLGPLPANTSDKAAHFAAYALLGALLARAVAGAVWAGYTRTSVWKAWTFATLYAVSDELHQTFVPGRTASLGDGLADSIGALAGAAAALLIARRVQRLQAEVRDSPRSIISDE